MDDHGNVREKILFGKYELGKLLGQGAYAKVYHARNLKTGQSVAIKAMSLENVLKRGLTEHVKREISIMHRLHHPHIVHILEVLATKTKIYFVLEFAKGGELWTKVKGRRLSEDVSRKYFQQLISALGYCHSRGVFHRDLKGENLLLDENLNLKVTDFGLSAVTAQIQPDGLLHTLCGTPAYLAPEILANKGYDGAKVDIWSCGIILYALNAGYFPFSDRNIIMLYRKIFKGEFRCPEWMSPELKRLLHRLLDSNPNTRITVDQIIDDPWFKKGYRHIQTSSDDLFGLEDYDDSNKQYDFLNAFDIISLSHGLDLSCLIDSPDCSVGVDRFVSAESPERIVRRIVEVAEAEEGRMTVVRKKDFAVQVVQGPNGDIVFTVDIHRLTDELVIVEIRRGENEDAPSLELWKDKLRTQLRTLV
ncbi:CBL-interacting serine/threonine-protein kinase 14-like [Rhododendron vialii]|uniref:CBL-interacting serine/threonine-protein kinase 14-like n=1 Tax=Rhododendron vialii TaxID=182163 RepID=UPI00265D6FCD|nr:CBL-interacting serine/threonine-protein kinase 14-like [Rhododendron vialii]